MKNFFVRYIKYLAALILFTSLLIGIENTPCTIKNQITSELTTATLSFFGKVLLQNFGFFVLIIFGCLFYNISTFCLIFYNGFIWGMFFKHIYCIVGWEKTLLIFLPHTVIEVIWIALATQLSCELSIYLYKFLNEESSLEVVNITINKNIINKVLLIFLLIFIGVSIETLSFNIVKF